MSARIRNKTHEPIGYPHVVVNVNRPKECTSTPPTPPVDTTALVQENKDLRAAVKLLMVGLALLDAKCKMYETKLKECNPEASKAVKAELEQRKTCRECAKKKDALHKEACRKCQKLAKTEIEFWKKIEEIKLKGD